MKQRLSLLIMLLALLLIAVPVSAQQVSTAEAYQTTGQFIVNKAPNPSFGDEWFIIALARGEYNVSKDY